MRGNIADFRQADSVYPFDITSSQVPAFIRAPRRELAAACLERTERLTISRKALLGMAMRQPLTPIGRGV
ncbi:hypothetical protein Desaf_0389 [Desulfocurvibacter africanus subsp. africanus str. Walvis Bay]|uniref:Uncharacterized protein n=1 Tax=Desulfocurvibacter africanus subsp. africanus str. Walvis Bay TaxID=690850 RepID=F3YVK8_DESAF|nr:hypothetical protein Desaf_0389 [Desulfocurvibacter africanus subsp. africanus str. Walvis Bay]